MNDDVAMASELLEGASMSGRPRLSVTNGFEGGDVDGLAWSPDAARLAIAHAGGLESGISVFDATTWRRCALFEAAAGSGLAWSPDGRAIASATYDGVLLIDPATGEQRLLAALERLRALAFEPSGRFLVTGSRWGEVTRIDVATGATRAYVPSEDDPTLHSVAFSPDAETIVAGLGDGRILRWSARSGDAGPTLVGHREAVMSVAFSPDGTLLASASFDSTVRLWNARTGELHAILEPPTNAVIACVSWSPDGRHLVSTEAYGATLWDVATERIVKPLPSINVGSIGLSGLTQWSPDGRTLASRRPMSAVTVHELEPGTDRLLGPHTVGATALAHATDAAAVWVGLDDGALIRWDLSTGRVVERLGGSGPAAESVELALGGRALVVRLQRSAIVLVDLATGTRREIVDEEHRADCASVSPDGRMLAVGGPERMVRVWDLEGGPPRLLGTHEGAVAHVAWSEDGRYLTSSANDGTARTWTLATGAWRDFPFVYSNHVVASPSHPLFARTDWQGCVVTRGPEGEVVATVRSDSAGFACIAFSPDGRWVALGASSGILRVYALETGELLETGRAHAHGVQAVAFSSAGDTLVTADGDGTIRVWSASTLEQRFALRAVGTDASYAFTPGPEGRVEIFGDAARACVQVAVGSRRVALDEAAQDLVVDGLVRRTLAR